MNQCQTNNQSIRQSIKESVNQWSKEAKNQWINEWVKQRDDESLNQWTNESVTQWINEPMNQWISHWLNKPVNQWMSEWINETNDQPINKSMNQWTAVNQWVMDSINQEPVNQWTSGSNNESVNQWITESKNLYCESMSQRRISEWTNERMNELMDGRLDGWMSGLLIFVELLLHWATSSPRHLLSTTSSRSSHLSGKPVICIPASSAVASATYFFCSSSCYRAFSSLRLQSHLPGALQQHLYFATRKRANAFCHHPIANPQSRSVAPNRPVFARRWQCGRFCATPIPSVFWNFWWNRALTTVWRTFCGPHLPKCSTHIIFLATVLCAELIFQKCSAPVSFKHWSENQALATVLYNFPRSRPALLEPSFGDTLRARECFYRWIHTLSSCSPSQLLDDGWLPFWWEC